MMTLNEIRKESTGMLKLRLGVLLEKKNRSGEEEVEREHLNGEIWLRDNYPQDFPDKITPESNITALDLSAPASNLVVPDAAMVTALEELLAMAKCGRLRWFWGVGLTRDHLATTMRAGAAPDPYAAAGRLTFLASEYADVIRENE